jgi:hypothetical protein
VETGGRISAKVSFVRPWVVMFCFILQGGCKMTSGEGMDVGSIKTKAKEMESGF